MTNPDHSALVGIGSNTGGPESACVSTSIIAAGQGHRLAHRHTHTERKTQMFSHCRIGTLAAPAIAKCQLPAIAEEEVMDTWEASLESYFTGWRDGYAQALDDVDSVIDEQRDGG